MGGGIHISAEGVSRTYNPGMPDEFQALRGVSLEISRGRTTVLKGPSGSGKTSLLSLLGCMARPTEGRILVDGKDVAKLPEKFLAEMRRNRFGFVFQQLNLIRNLSVLENVLLPLYPGRYGFSEMKERAGKLLQRFDIAGKEHFRARQLSGGEQQRVALARALINDPEIIVADEPTAHLDSGLSSELMEILSLLKGEGRTIIIATHDPFVYSHSSVDSSVTMRDGRIRPESKG